jgi:hypothetical protein
MFGDWEEVIGKICWDLHMMNQMYDVRTEQDKLDWLN